ncbi:MAG: ankyrin repeat domain-containing protein [Alphaproteobacteria bacterium]|nr:ankyrin repeat domain-containing protein [Alphaproteobacteria bacterium]
MSDKEKLRWFTDLEILRFVVNILDIQLGKKELNDQIDKHNFHVAHDYIPQFIKTNIRNKLKKNIGKDNAQLLCHELEEFFAEYLKFVGDVPSLLIFDESFDDKMLRHTSLFATSYMIKIVAKLAQKSKMDDWSELFSHQHKTTIGFVLEWLNDNISDWKTFVNSFDTIEKAKLSRWRTGEYLPSHLDLQDIFSWQKQYTNKAYQHQISTLLLLARAIDAFKTYDLGKEILPKIQGRIESFLPLSSLNADLIKSIKGGKHYIEEFIANTITNENKPLLQITGERINKIHELLNIFLVNKDPALQKHITEKLAELSTLAKSTDKGNILYPIHWLTGIFNMLSGNSAEACRDYEQAFEQSLYRFGNDLKGIIGESLTIMSQLDKPDNVFLKKLQNANIKFYGALPANLDREQGKLKRTDVVQDWQIDESKNMPLITHDGEIKPDYKNINKKITDKKCPQIIYFALEHEADVASKSIDIVKQLLLKGASVNGVTKLGNTLLSVALHQMNVTDIQNKVDDSLYRLLLPYMDKFNDKTINLLTEKKRHLPIILAVETGRFDVVECISNLKGIDINKQGHTDFQTALYVCINLIGMRQKSIQEIIEILQVGLTNPTSHTYDAITRHSPSPVSTAKIISEMQSAKTAQIMFEQQAQRYKALSLDALRDIAKLLLKKGADPNAEYNGGSAKYRTPLMLVAELDEIELFQQMVEKYGGDINKQCRYEGQSYDCKYIAYKFGATDIQKFLTQYS